MLREQLAIDSNDLAQVIERRINHNAWGRIRRLQVAVADDRVVVRGSTGSYYFKQLALQAIREVVDTAPLDVNIEVIPSTPSTLGYVT